MVRKRSIATLVSGKEIAFLRDCYPKVKNRSALTAAFNTRFKHDYTTSQIRAVLLKHGITSGRTGRFQPGHIPWTAHEKGTGRVKSNSTSFIVGNVPATTKALYSERINVNGYIEIKIPVINPYTYAKTRYVNKHIWLWEQHHGKVKKGCCIVFLDSNRLNCVLSNLSELSKAENLIRNTLKNDHSDSALFRETVKLVHNLQSAVKQAKKRV